MHCKHRNVLILLKLILRPLTTNVHLPLRRACLMHSKHCDVLFLCVHPQPAEFEFYDPQSPMYTSPRVVPPSCVENSKIVDTIISQVRASAFVGKRAGFCLHEGLSHDIGVQSSSLVYV